MSHLGYHTRLLSSKTVRTCPVRLITLHNSFISSSRRLPEADHLINPLSFYFFLLLLPVQVQAYCGITHSWNTTGHTHTHTQREACLCIGSAKQRFREDRDEAGALLYIAIWSNSKQARTISGFLWSFVHEGKKENAKLLRLRSYYERQGLLGSIMPATCRCFEMG